MLKLSAEQIFDVLSYVNHRRQLIMGKLYENPGITTKMKKDAYRDMFSYFRAKGIVFGKPQGQDIPLQKDSELHFKDFLQARKKEVSFTIRRPCLGYS